MSGWRDSAPCRDVPIDVFFPDHVAGYKVALEFCRTCPHRVQCLDEELSTLARPTISTSDLFGIVGGTAPVERRRPALARWVAEHGRPEWGAPQPPADLGPLMSYGGQSGAPVEPEAGTVELPRPRRGPAPQHGREPAFRVYGCRCSVCVTAQRERWRAATRRKKTKAATGRRREAA